MNPVPMRAQCSLSIPCRHLSRLDYSECESVQFLVSEERCRRQTHAEDHPGAPDANDRAAWTATWNNASPRMANAYGKVAEASTEVQNNRWIWNCRYAKDLDSVQEEPDGDGDEADTDSEAKIAIPDTMDGACAARLHFRHRCLDNWFFSAYNNPAFLFPVDSKSRCCHRTELLRQTLYLAPLMKSEKRNFGN